MKLLAVTPLLRNRDKSRLWIETRRLEAMGFPPGTPFSVEARGDELVLRPRSSPRTMSPAAGLRPIIDVASQAYTSDRWRTFPNSRSRDGISACRSHPPDGRRRSCAVATLTPPFRVLEVFAGGGTLTAAVARNEAYAISAGIEIDPRFADIWQAAPGRRAHPGRHPRGRDVRPSRVRHPSSVGFRAPTTPSSWAGQEGPRGKSELGDTGGPLPSVIGIVREQMPAAILFENVPFFETSQASQL